MKLFVVVGLPLAAMTAAALLALASACADPNHDSQVAALGGEDPNVPPGPDHRPGQPCNVCHGGQGPAKIQFSVAGTVYLYPQDTTQPANGALVQVEDSTGSTWHVSARQSGNFFVLQSEWPAVFPVACPSMSLNGQSLSMTTLDNREGSCNACHTTKAGPDSVGNLYVNPSPPGGGG